MADYIDREAALREIAQYTRHYWPTVSYVESIIKTQPAADVEPVRHGLWLPDGEILICLNCEAEIEVKNTFGEYNHRNFCPNCGAKMDGGEVNAAD